MVAAIRNGRAGISMMGHPSITTTIIMVSSSITSITLIT